MSHNEELDNKVISLFSRHHKGERLHGEDTHGGELVESPDGYWYISFKLNPQGDPFKEEMLLELAYKKHYILRFLESHHDYPRLNNYHVPGDQLQAFLLTLAQRPGKLLEIEPYHPDLQA